MTIQQRDEKNCGQRCLAYILGVSLDKAIELVGHNKPTKSKELTPHFNSGKNKRGYPIKNALCIMRPNNRKGGDWHWIVVKDKNVYDPCAGIMPEEHFKKEFLEEARITSHFEIL